MELAAKLYQKHNHKKVLCVARNFIESPHINPTIYDIPVSSMRRSGVETPVQNFKNTAVGVNLGILFGQKIERTSNWDNSRRLENSIMGYFCAVKFHNYAFVKEA